MKPEEFGKVMEVGDLVAVHLTRYLPEGRVLKTLNSVFPEATLRNTVHFAINHPVQNVSFYGNWDTTKYAVIAPLEQLCKEGNNQVRNFNVIDTYFVGDVTLPKSSTVIASAYAYEDLIERGVVDRDTLLSKFGDERCPPEPDDQLIIEKDGVRYVILSWKSKNLREETYKEIARQGYECMLGGMWNWGGGSWGADKEDQERIATKIGAPRTGPHSADTELDGLEYFGCVLAGMSSEEGRRKINAFLGIKERCSRLDTMELDDDGYAGLKLLEGGDPNHFSIQTVFEALRELKDKLPDTYHRRLDAFVESNREKLRAFIPPEIVKEYALPL